MRKVTIGDLVVVPGEPPDGNPFKACYAHPPQAVCGAQRAALLRAFKNGGDTTGYTFWDCRTHDAPAERRVTDPALVDWTGLRE